MAKQIITIPYTPREWAKKLHNSKERWKVLVLHRRAGKTVAVINHLIRDALTTPNAKYAYIAPTYKQAKNIAWDYLKFYSFPIPNAKPNESELKIDFPNGSRIQLFGSENIDALRGIGLWGGAQDESSQQPSNLFSEIISKCLADHLGYWIWLGTPKGKNQLYRTYTTAKNDDDYFSMFMTIEDSLRDENGETIDNLRIALEDDRKLVARGEMTQEEFDQEWYCSFEAAIKGAYYAKEIGMARKENRIREIPYDPAMKVHTIWDLGIGQKLAIGFYQKEGVNIRMIDFWEGSEKDGIPQAIKVLQDKPYIYGMHYAPHDINTTDIGTGKSRKETASNLGITFMEIPKLLVDDGINAGRLVFARLYVDENKCALWLDYISQYKQEWTESKGMFKEKPLHDFTSHAADVHRYMAIVESRMTNYDYNNEQEDKSYDRYAAFGLI